MTDIIRKKKPCKILRSENTHIMNIVNRVAHLMNNIILYILLYVFQYCSHSAFVQEQKQTADTDDIKNAATDDIKNFKVCYSVTWAWLEK